MTLTAGLDDLRDLADELRRQKEASRDIIADTRRTTLAQPTLLPAEPEDDDRFGRGLNMIVDLPGDEGVGEFPINRHAHQQIAEKLALPWKTYDRLLGTHPDLLANLGNGLLNREPAKRLLRVLDGSVRAVLSDSYRPRDNWDLLNQAVLPELQAFPGSVTVKACELTPTRMYVKTVFPDIEAPITPKVGDVVRAGLIIQNSEVGNGALGVFPYSDRLICTNGMVHTNMGQRTVHVGRRHTGDGTTEAWDLYSDATLALDDAAFFSKCRDTIRGVLNGAAFDQIVEQMRDLAGFQIQGKVPETLELLAGRVGITGPESESMLDILIREGDLSGWGLVNSITQTARDLDDADRRVELETLAGRLTADPTPLRAVALSA